MTSKIDIKKYGLAFIAILLAFEYIYMPWQNWLEQMNDEIERKAVIVAKQTKAIEKKQVYDRVIEEFETSFKQATDDFDVIKDNGQASLNWLSEVDYVAKKFNVPLKSKTPQELVQINDSFVGFQGRVLIEGDISTLLTYLAEIDKGQKGNIVTNIRLIKRRNNVRAPYSIDLEILKVFKVIS